MPATLRPSIQTSLGHLICASTGSASHTATAAASGSVSLSSRSTADISTAVLGGAHQVRPWRPRPACCSSAVTSVPCGAPAEASTRARSLVEAQIKWPNDVWIEGRKVAGILVEARPQEGWAVLGIGLNVTNEEFPPELHATSLRLAGSALSPDEALAALMASLEAWLGRPPAEVLAAWRERDALPGRTVRWADGSRAGVAAGVDDSGALIVDTVDGRVALDAGEVHLSEG